MVQVKNNILDIYCDGGFEEYINVFVYVLNIKEYCLVIFW